MIKSILFSFVLLLLSICTHGQQSGTFKDPRDGITYKTIKIGNQTWMAENLMAGKFRNNDPIPEAKKDEEWSVKKAAWCFYDNDPANGEKYGKLYNWYAMTDPRGLAPEGWHIPTNADWQKLAAFLGGIEEAGTKMKSKSGWNENGNGSNECGFSGLPGSLRYDNGQFNDIGRMGYWWSTTPNIMRTLSYTLNNSNSYMGWGQGHANETYGFSVRCIKDN